MKLYKKVFVILMIVIMLFTPTFVFANERNGFCDTEKMNFARRRAEIFLERIGYDVILNETILLKNLNDEYEAVCFGIEESGYIIVNLNDFSVPEWSPTGTNPYNNVSDPIYNGPMNYYKKVGRQILSINDGSALKLTDVRYVYAAESIVDQEHYFDSFFEDEENNLRHINVEKYISGSLKPWRQTCSNCCGATASAICMRYYYDYVSTAYVSHDKIEREPLISLMRQYVGPNYTTTTMMRVGLQRYLNSRPVNNNARSGNFSFSTIKGKINGSRPVIIGTQNDSTYGNHWMIVHGFFESIVDGKYVIVNNGYGSNNVWLDITRVNFYKIVYFDN